MIFRQFCALTILLFVSTMSVSVHSKTPLTACAFVFNPEDGKAEKAHREEVVKTSLFLNLAFPQMYSGVGGGMVAFYLSREIPLATILSPLSHRELERMTDAMNRAHGAHGIEIKVSSSQINLIHQRINIQDFETRLAKTILVLAPELGNLRLMDLTAEFETNPAHQAKLILAKSYALTVMEALRSSESLSLSREHRQHQRYEIPKHIRQNNILITENSLHELIANRLIAEHPELSLTRNTFFGVRFKKPRTLATLLWLNMAGWSLNDL